MAFRVIFISILFLIANVLFNEAISTIVSPTFPDYACISPRIENEKCLCNIFPCFRIPNSRDFQCELNTRYCWFTIYLKNSISIRITYRGQECHCSMENFATTLSPTTEAPTTLTPTTLSPTFQPISEPILQDPAPDITTIGIFNCDGCPFSNFDNSQLIQSYNTSVVTYEGNVFGADGDGIWYLVTRESISQKRQTDENAIGGVILTNPNTGRYRISIPLFCGEQRLKCVWNNEQGRYVISISIIRTNCINSDIKVTLTWDSLKNDLDLHFVRFGFCVDSEGDAYYGNRDTFFGAKLDIDCISDCATENVFLSNPVVGHYAVLVHNFNADEDITGQIFTIVGNNERIVRFENIPFKSYVLIAIVSWPDKNIEIRNEIVESSYCVPAETTILYINDLGNEVSNDEIKDLFIDENANMPSIKAKLSNNLDGVTKITWTLTIEDPYAGCDTFIYNSILEPNEIFQVDFENTVIGGFGKIEAKPDANQQLAIHPFTFNVTAKRNPTCREIIDKIESQNETDIWFAVRVAAHESLFRQFEEFSSSGRFFPLKSFDNGFGLFQLTNPAPDCSQKWSWIQNIEEGISRLRNNAIGADRWMNGANGQRIQAFNDVGMDVTVPVEIVGDCVFEDRTNITIEDAVAIKLYNGASGGNYVAWDNPNRLWKFNRINNLGFNYVGRICDPDTTHLINSCPAQ